MGSNGRLPAHPYRRPLPGPAIGHHDSIPPEMLPQHGGYPPFDMMPRPEIMEQKLAAQHVEMQKLATENQRFAATHGTLRQDLTAIQHELQMLHNHVGGVKSEREQQIVGLLDKIGKMEADLKGAEPIKMELHQARTEAQGLLAARDELVSRVQQLSENHQRVHMDLQQIPSLMSELEGLRQEYQHCRATYDYEKKVYNEHLESLQVMEKNYMTMASEVEKLRAELKKHAENDRRNAVGPYAGFAAGHNEKEASGHYPVGQNTYEMQRGGPPPGVQKGPGAPAYDPQRGPVAPTYDPQRGPVAPTFDPQRVPNVPGYDPHRGPPGPGYEPYRVPGGSGYDRQRGPQFGGPGYDANRGTGTNFESPQGQANNTSFGSVTAPAHTGGGYQGAQAQPPPPPPADGNHPARR